MSAPTDIYKMIGRPSNKQGRLVVIDLQGLSDTAKQVICALLSSEILRAASSKQILYVLVSWFMRKDIISRQLVEVPSAIESSRKLPAKVASSVLVSPSLASALEARC